MAFVSIWPMFLITAASIVQAAPTFTLVYSFQYSATNGYNPWANVVTGPGGVIYGTTFLGGPAGGGVYSLTPPPSAGASWSEAFYGFPSSKAGSDVRAGVVLGPHGDLYGTTIDGGRCGYGNVFELKPPAAPGGAWVLEELVSFCPESDQASPSTPYGNLVIGPGGTLYGTSYYGGTAGYGTVFSLTPPAAAGGAWTETVLYSFQGVPTAPGPKAVSRSAAAVCCTALLSQAELVHATWSVSVAAQLTH